MATHPASSAASDGQAGTASPIRIADKASAEHFVAGLIATMGELEAVLRRESDGVRGGRIREALSDIDRKTALSSTYVNGLEAAKSNAIALARFTPAGLEALKRAHRAFAASVETNQTVLATARTVSEGLIRTLADEIGRARTPTVYGAPSTAPSPYGRGATGGPLVFSKSL